MIGATLKYVSGWLDRRARLASRADAAVKAVLLAANETKLHLARARDRKKPDLDREQLLVRLWTDAAVAIRRSDPDLAMRLQMKAEYWANPRNWTRREVRAAGIEIDRIAGAARGLLRRRRRR